MIDDSYLVLEYVPGPSLREHEPSFAIVSGFFGLLLETVRAMHAAGIAHGDLKRKDNIIVGAGERPYMIDFGIATLRGGSWPGSALVRARQQVRLQRVGEAQVPAPHRARRLPQFYRRRTRRSIGRC